MELARLAKIRAEREAAAKRAEEEVKAKVLPRSPIKHVHRYT
jgi:hypothetical protein